MHSRLGAPPKEKNLRIPPEEQSGSPIRKLFLPRALSHELHPCEPDPQDGDAGELFGLRVSPYPGRGRKSDNIDPIDGRTLAKRHSMPNCPFGSASALQLNRFRSGVVRWSVRPPFFRARVGHSEALVLCG